MADTSLSPISASLCDIGAAAVASSAISPLVAVIDSSVIKMNASPQRISLRSLLWDNIRPIIRSPFHFLSSRPTRLLFTVYFGTYTTANAIDSFADRSPGVFPSISPSIIKLLGVSAISTSLTVYKDSCLAQMFGAVSRQRVPPASYMLFAVRDVSTIYGCMVLPPLLARRLDDMPIEMKNLFSLSSLQARERASQLLLPIMVQFFSTPIHLLALDLHNRRNGLGMFARWARLQRDLPVAVSIRIVRILPAFGVGGVLNNEARRAMRQALGIDKPVFL